MIKDIVLKHQKRYQRRVKHIRVLGLPPTDDRGFVPRLYEKESWLDRAFTVLQEDLTEKKNTNPVQRKKSEDSYPYPRKPTWSKPPTPDDAPPSWDNIVRAYEDCMQDL